MRSVPGVNAVRAETSDIRMRGKNIGPAGRWMGEVEGEESGQPILKTGKESWASGRVAMCFHLNQVSNSASRAVVGAPTKPIIYTKNYKSVIPRE